MGQGHISIGTKETGDAGFTLLEVLVALGVLSMSLGVLWLIFSQGLDRTRLDETRTIARALAQSLLAEAQNSPASDLKTASGDTGQFHWRVGLSPYGSTEDRQTWSLSPTNISIDVTWVKDGHTGSVSLMSLRLLPKGAQ